MYCCKDKTKTYLICCVLYYILFLHFQIFCPVTNCSGIYMFKHFPMDFLVKRRGDWHGKSFVLLLHIFLLLPTCSSDFNVIMPELCDAPGFINLTWIHNMVHLGIRDEQTPLSVNIVKLEGTLNFYNTDQKSHKTQYVKNSNNAIVVQTAIYKFKHNLEARFSLVYLIILVFHSLSTDICDGSKGLLKFMSIMSKNPQEGMIASLGSHLCPTAATFCQTNLCQLLSWTCPQVSSN